MASIAVTERACGAVIDGDKKCGETIVAGVAHKVLVEARDQFGCAKRFAAGREHLAAQSGLETGHEERGGNSLAGDICDGNGYLRGAQLNKIVVIPADGARGLTDGFDFYPGNRGDLPGEKLILHFPGDGDFIFEALTTGFFVNQIADGTGHLVE